MKTITSNGTILSDGIKTLHIDNVCVPIFNGHYEVCHFLKKGESVSIPDDLWNLQDVAKQMQDKGTITVV